MRLPRMRRKTETTAEAAVHTRTENTNRIGPAYPVYMEFRELILLYADEHGQPSVATDAHAVEWDEGRVHLEQASRFLPSEVDVICAAIAESEYIYDHITSLRSAS
jgi:hypothetical protein